MPTDASPELNREVPLATPNPLDLQGIEFIEYATSQPQALGHELLQLGFQAVARHRSREVTLYRLGEMNVVVNAHSVQANSRLPARVLSASPEIVAIALRVRNAAAAYEAVVSKGAWPVVGQVAVMELNIPAIHGVGNSKIFFVDRHETFSIYEVDFIPLPAAKTPAPNPQALQWFGVVQYVGLGRLGDWLAFYERLFGIKALDDEQRFGILPKGKVLASPCGGFYIQLIEPNMDALEDSPLEHYHRVAFSTPDVMQAVSAMQANGLRFVDFPTLAPSAKGALSQTVLGSLCFEWVKR
jgi:4-hydroxyphenylpyruvate dioxygenase